MSPIEFAGASMRIAVTVSECGLIPRGYAVAYWMPWSMQAVCYPIGLHLIVSIARSAYTRFIHLRCPEGWETLWRVRFEIGRERGYAAGYEAAFRHMEITLLAIRDEKTEGRDQHHLDSDCGFQLLARRR